MKIYSILLLLNIKYTVLCSVLLILLPEGYGQNNKDTIITQQQGKDNKIIKKNTNDIKDINDIGKKFFIGYDIIKELIDEHSLTLGYNIFKNQFITFSYGYTYPYSSESDISPNQSEYPLFIYSGPTLRMGYEFHPDVISYPYFGLDLYYKDLSFNNINLYNEAYDNENTFTQSETAKVYGWHLNFGFMINFNYLFLNFSVGAGETTKYRNYTVSNSFIGNNFEWEGPKVIDGTFSETQHYFSGIIGLNVGFRF